MATYRMPTFPPRRIRKFWNNVEKKSPNECWEWIGATDSKGYGKFFSCEDGSHKLLISHRIAYFLANGVDPGDEVVCHSCDNPLCCNPAHLWLGTHQDNIDDMCRKGRQGRAASTLSDNDVFMMREFWYSRMFTQSEIGTMYGLTKPAVCNIVNGNTFKNVPMPPGEPPKHGHRWRG